MAKNQDLINDLAQSLDEAQWGWLYPHLQRGAVILVSNDLNLVEVGKAIANDTTTLVKGWIQKRLIGKPTVEQIQLWDKSPEKKFMSIVVQPYVLVQEMLSH
jgi:hypothetical protein